ncbi:hypothetical protein HanPI659440_Chr11g0430531 [Helianthus annuus]|nr:hypothetical protein HanPI659440_Chr11g0430531 [Helianthus annuus]
MLFLLRKLSIPLSSLPSLTSVSLSRTTTIMTTNPISSRLAILAQQLRLYKPPDSDTDKVDQPPEKLQNPNPNNRAAVLICLFHGHNYGDDSLRVILTKRSSDLSAHSESYI